MHVYCRLTMIEFRYDVKVIRSFMNATEQGISILHKIALVAVRVLHKENIMQVYTYICRTYSTVTHVNTETIEFTSRK